MGRKFSFPCVDICSDVPKCEFSLKNSSLKCWLCFHLFLWRTQICGFYGYNFVAPLRLLEIVLSRQDGFRIILRYLGNIYCKSSTWKCLGNILKMSYREKKIPRQSQYVLKMSCVGWVCNWSHLNLRRRNFRSNRSQMLFRRSCSSEFHSIHRKTHVLESLFKSLHYY